MRRLAARAHLWGGLVSSPLLFVLGLSGSVLVFAPEIERLERPGAHATASAVAPSLDAVVAAALVGQPGGEARALRVPTPRGGPFVVDVAVGGRRLDVAVDAVTLRVLDARAPERSVIAAVRSLHAAFHAGRGGALLVGLLGVWLVVESATGLWLYGPSIARRVRGRSGVIHRVVGVCALAVGAIVGFTGALLSVTALSPAGTMQTSPGRLARLDVVTARVPPGERIVGLIAASAHRVRVETRRPDGGVRALIIDADTGDIVTASASPGRWDIVRRLHGGDFAGWPSRLLFAAAGFALPVLSITGFLLAARRSRTVTRHRASSTRGGGRRRPCAGSRRPASP